ncbi:MAG: ABC transporter [Candidatus Raymondbacteria bacterium RifOxyA12_full_50_37]|nr:MAG: ABC transporter [Candidatus Raymondbacteria bacterium RifOxyA12_full_50_37]OGJ91185.1 MAG: ABC transporter [Candidatus Raymondbacteria bacterium RIFOXYA2_FULL_49_16]OGJ96318.1 MAG: ABC transporter [Candidatus Raymondbacteria bacterium RifOxyC12_full_50_8]OGJ97583.1 MAG: ABC transporter [Candidatus Raymondbacteria bacterium RIFOXYC2_FULL_50_21]OGP44412.1 MAG: ABC transporter [Candidatus Raymondbacteria bacterium RIFOXYB2_FULL_49_35]
MTIVKAENVGKFYETGTVTVQALKDVSFSIEAGTITSFIGPSGSGKTTLLNLIGCLDKPSSGRLDVGGSNVLALDRTNSAKFRGGNIGFIFQDFNLVPILTVYENVEYPLVMVRDTPAAERRKLVLNLLEAVEMADQSEKYPDQISGGQKQRVAIARALVTSPKLVLADEPTANLDHKTAYMILSLMKKMRDELSTTFIFSTHDPKIVGEAECIYTIEDGILTGQQEKGAANHA